MPLPRSAGVTVPLFSIRTRDDWGIGQNRRPAEVRSLGSARGAPAPAAPPPYELAAGETSPYGARTAFGLDPIYISVDQVHDLDRGAVDEALGASGRRDLESLRAAPRVEYAAARALKLRVLRQAFERFHAREWKRGTPRAEELAKSIERERAWAEDLALYVALRDSHGMWGWEKWPNEERHRVPHVLSRARETLATPILEHHYMQWVAHEQWMRAREAMQALGVELMGDLPFIVCSESADVWARSWQFRRDVSLGAPPDAFSPEGQDWGLPAYDWRAMEEDDLEWLRARTRHAARLYDRFRLDHVVGYFRMYVRKPGERGYFDPEGEDTQQARGARVLRAMIEERGEGERAHGAGHRGGPRRDPAVRARRRSASWVSRATRSFPGRRTTGQTAARSATRRSSAKSASRRGARTTPRPSSRGGTSSRCREGTARKAGAPRARRERRRAALGAPVDALQLRGVAQLTLVQELLGSERGSTPPRPWATRTGPTGSPGPSRTSSGMIASTRAWRRSASSSSRAGESSRAPAPSAHPSLVQSSRFGSHAQTGPRLPARRDLDAGGVNFALFSQHATRRRALPLRRARRGGAPRHACGGQRTSGTLRARPRGRASATATACTGRTSRAGAPLQLAQAARRPVRARAFTGRSTTARRSSATRPPCPARRPATASSTSGDDAWGVPQSVVVRRLLRLGGRRASRGPVARHRALRASREGVHAAAPATSRGAPRDVPRPRERGRHRAPEVARRHDRRAPARARDVRRARSSPRGLTNYWGYCTLGFFAPDQRFATTPRRRTQCASSRRW